VTIEMRPPLEFILRQSGAFRRKLSDLASLWERFKPIMGELERDWFDSRGRGSWPPLSEYTLREKEALGYPLDPLVRTGNLRDSLVDPQRAMHAARDTAWYGTDVAYARWHQTGGFVPGRPPMRQVIPDPFPVETRRRLEQEMVAWIDQAAAETWGRV
jgi:phage gpG-like protein